jgi:bifunctional UDP-N-acetylglucosamine pyrophosphorylase/glucosamine-1-phosphate N-acetyltransferase
MISSGQYKNGFQNKKKVGIASLILSAGKGSRMKGFKGNKTLLPLVPGASLFEGSHPILLRILNHLPPGPKALVVHYKKEDVLEATQSLGLTYCEQPTLNGTGGALLAARRFFEENEQGRVIITMGDVPFVQTETYYKLIEALKHFSLVILGFSSVDKKQYGLLEVDGDEVKRIIEWQYWSNLPQKRQAQLQICNAGIYAARMKDLMKYLPILAERPHIVLKERGGRRTEVEEFFITDLIELMHQEGLKIGYAMAGDENEVMGVDDLAALKKAQEIFKTHKEDFDI